MTRIKNEAFRNKKAIIGSYEVEFNAEGIAEVTAETAAGVAAIPGYEILPPLAPEPMPEPMPEPIIDEPAPLPEMDAVVFVSDEEAPEPVVITRQPTVELKKNKGGRPRKS